MKQRFMYRLNLAEIWKCAMWLDKNNVDNKFKSFAMVSQNVTKYIYI